MHLRLYISPTRLGDNPEAGAFGGSRVKHVKCKLKESFNRRLAASKSSSGVSAVYHTIWSVVQLFCFFGTRVCFDPAIHVLLL
jgi:hypothetical protein